MGVDMISRSRLALTIPVIALMAAGCAADPSGADTETVLGHGVDRFPSESLTDWVSYADYVSLFTVLDEQELAMGDHEEQHGA
jgi:hypothetical protein